MNPYEVLGVRIGASADEIKRAYRELSRKWHPDRPGGSEARMKEINAAYSKLIDGAPTGQRTEKTWTPPKTGGTKDPFGFNSYQYAYWEQVMRNDRQRQQQAWSRMKYEYGFFDDEPKKQKPCPHCKGTGKVDA